MPSSCTSGKSKATRSNFEKNEKYMSDTVKALPKDDVEPEQRPEDLSSENSILRLQYLKKDGEADIPIVSVNRVAIDKCDAEKRVEVLAMENKVLMNENEQLKMRLKGEFQGSHVGMLDTDESMPVVSVNAMATEKIEAEQKVAELAAENEALRIEIENMKNAMIEDEIPHVCVNAMAIEKIEAEQKAAELAAENEALRIEMLDQESDTVYLPRDYVPCAVSLGVSYRSSFRLSSFVSNPNRSRAAYDDREWEEEEDEEEDWPRLPFPCSERV